MTTPPNQKTPEAQSEPRDFHNRGATATRQSGSLGTGRYEPRDLAELMRYCKIVIQSDLCPRHIKSPADAMLIIQRGAELGLSAVNALQNLNVISGKVTMPAALAVGVVKASEACEYFTCIESTDTISTGSRRAISRAVVVLPQAVGPDSTQHLLRSTCFVSSAFAMLSARVDKNAVLS